MDLNIKINDKGHLDIGGADACDLVEQYGTPIYVIDEERIRDNYNRFYNAFTKFYPKFKVFYACKANTNISLRKKDAALMLYLLEKCTSVKKWDSLETESYSQETTSETMRWIM